MNSTIATINVLIQGLFFLEHKQNHHTRQHILEVVAPNLHDHHFFGGFHRALADLDGQTIDWTGTGLQGGTPRDPIGKSTIFSDIPPTLPKFDRTVTQTGSLMGRTKGRLLLPWPLGFFSGRNGPKPAYGSRSTTKPPATQVGTEVDRHCTGGRVGVVTGLSYEYLWPLPTLPWWRPVINLHFYFQPHKIHTVQQVNADLVAAADIFDSPDDFDIQIRPDSSGVAIPIGKTPLPVGVGPEDELALGEDIQQIDLPDLRKLLENLDGKTVEQQIGAKQRKVAPSDTSAEAPNFLITMTSANCPHFYVGP